ncbi:G-type lectin S-receptor-like serine/threonine-protein kinase SD1-1 [Abeliophyllum distichum]|uniref:non-specific serine/threonine protein kinase n=1 Tax=Abeliophyllum distichum TaxID=126358 RepID=A0ABD1UF20_9LAMI
MSLKECRAECLKSCSCIAYANSDIREGGSGCFMWFGYLIDIREFSEEKQQYIYIRMAAAELNNNKKTRLVLILVVSLVCGMLILGFLIFCLIKKRKMKRASDDNVKDIELPMFDLTTVTNATKNFSLTNMIGEGGFGIMYKGTLPTGQEVTVKRLSKNSGQGLQEFRGEVILIAKLQHRNLVRLLGCCVEGDERMLIYKYMPNKSLDHFIFDSNLNPKISDFGLARSFCVDQTESKTKRIVGTHGYMSPEYVVDGNFSVKSDVFSFGVLLLEMEWLLWKEGRALELVDDIC